MLRVYGWRAGPRLVFDWQTTAPESIVEYLSRSFRGFFERGDLVPFKGTVRNERYLTTHQHEFPKQPDEIDIDRLYPAARQLHDLWCARAQKAVTRRGATLFVLARPLPEELVVEIDARIRAIRGRRPYLLLRAPEGDSNESWQGDEGLWRRHLAPYSVQPTLRAYASYRFYRVRKKLRRRFGLPVAIPEHPSDAVFE